MLCVNKVHYFSDYKLYVELSSGVAGYFDVSPYLNKGIFTQLKEVDYLQLVKTDTFGVYWPKGQDFSADTIQHELQPIID